MSAKVKVVLHCSSSLTCIAVTCQTFQVALSNLCNALNLFQSIVILSFHSVLTKQLPQGWTKTSNKHLSFKLHTLVFPFSELLVFAFTPNRRRVKRHYSRLLSDFLWSHEGLHYFFHIITSIPMIFKFVEFPFKGPIYFLRKNQAGAAK